MKVEEPVYQYFQCFQASFHRKDKQALSQTGMIGM